MLSRPGVLRGFSCRVFQDHQVVHRFTSNGQLLLANRIFHRTLPCQERLDFPRRGWAVPKDNPELLAQLNNILKRWKKDGTLDDVIDDWITVKKTTIEVKPQ